LTELKYKISAGPSHYRIRESFEFFGHGASDNFNLSI